MGHGFGTVSIAENRIYVAGDVGDKTVISALFVWEIGRHVPTCDKSPDFR